MLSISHFSMRGVLEIVSLNMNKKIDIINPTKKGLCMAIKTEYAQAGWSSMFRDDGFRMTGIKETISEPCTCAIRGRYVGEYEGYVQTLDQGGNVANCVTTVKKDSMIIEPQYRIRKLTERECFRLMDVDEKYINAIQRAGISKTQQYKMAGNSIVVSCMEHIFRKLFINKEVEPNKDGQLSLFM